ncbi:MAG: hypothetical protein V1659_05725 [Candidatus Woesearchaeota archaeon]
MKNKIVIAAFLALALLVPAVLAYISPLSTKEIALYEKNPADWSIIEGGAHGVVIMETGTMRTLVWGLNPATEYTLIYYGDATHNDVWPYATCIKTFRTSLMGYARSLSGKFSYSGFLSDQTLQKFWVVKASDVNCATGRMTAWHPTEYLFESMTV